MDSTYYYYLYALILILCYQIYARLDRFLAGFSTALDLNKDSSALFQRCQSQRIASLPFPPVLNHKSHLVIDPELIQKVYATPPGVLDHQILHHDSDHYFWGASKDYLTRFTTYKKAIEIVYEELKRQPMEIIGERFTETLEDELSNMVASIQETTTHSIQLSYSESLNAAFFQAVDRAVYGSTFPTAECRKLFTAFDSGFPLVSLAVALPIPIWLSNYLFAREVNRSRSELVKLFAEWMRNDGYLDGAEFIRKSIPIWLKSGCSVRDVAAPFVGMEFGLQANSTKTAFWLLYNIIQSPPTLTNVRSEILHLRQTNSDRLTVTNLSQKMPFLSSVLYETLRCHSSTFTFRLATMDAVITTESGTILNVKKNEVVVMANLVPHLDTRIFQDPEVFKADRFMNVTTAAVVENEKSYSTSKHLLAFGGGLGVCKGRHFAIFSELLYVIRILELFDIKVIRLEGSQGVPSHTACGTSFKLPSVRPDRIGAGSMMPEGEIILEISLREDQ